MGVECMLLVREPCVLLGITRCGHATIGEANGEVAISARRILDDSGMHMKPYEQKYPLINVGPAH